MSKKIVVGITGASGAAYAGRLVGCLAASGVDIHVVISPHGRMLLQHELGMPEATPESLVGREAAGAVTMHPYDDLAAPPASGSFLTDGMVICPCSSNTLASVAAGTASNLITRSAAVHLKEARRLVLLTREMPVSRIDLQNMLDVSQAGGIICPASPGFYMTPRSVGDLVDFVVGRLCDLLGVPHGLSTRWEQARCGTTEDPGE